MVDLGFDWKEAFDKFGNAGNAAGGVLSKLGSAITGFFLSPLGKVTAVIAGVAAAFALLDLAIVTPAEATEKMNDAFNEFEDAKKKVTSINSELETAKARIAELEAKGGLTFVEESELNKLRASVRLLEIQADLAEKAAAKEAREAAEAAVESYEKNFTVEISEEKVSEYLNGIKNGEYQVGDLVMGVEGVNNVSAAIAASYCHQ